MTDTTIELLLVDDSPEDLTILKRLLLAEDKGAKFTINTTSAPVQALQWCNANPPECLLLDYAMPEMDGLEFLDRLADKRPELPLPTIVLTGRGDELIAVQAMKSGAHDYVIKQGVTGPILVHAIENAIAKFAAEKEAKARQRDLELFVDTAAHDFKGPLNVLMMEMELARSHMIDRSDDLQAIHDRFDRMMDRISQLGQMIDSMREFAREDHPIGELVCVELRAVINRVLENLDAALMNATVTATATDGVKVKGDEDLLIRVFQNLIENSIKFRGDRPASVRVYEQADARTDDTVEIVVEDEGVGFPIDDAERIFKPLFRSEHTRQAPGYGLGLATCRRIVERLGGRIWARALPNNGARIHIRLLRGQP